jgi:hypothetical protein
VLVTSATVLLYAAVLGAAVSWIVGAVSYLRCLRALAAESQPRVSMLAVVAWPFALKHIKGAAAEHAARTNKALVAFFACLMVAAAAGSLVANLNRISK